MADKADKAPRTQSEKAKAWQAIVAEAGALLKGKKNGTGKAVGGPNVAALASAIKAGNMTKRNNILRRFATANGAAAAAAAAAGMNVAGAAIGAKGASPLKEANIAAAKAALNAALASAGQTRKASQPAASRYAKLLKEGKAANAKAYLNTVLAKAAEKGAEAASKAAAVEAVKAAKASIGTNAEISNILKRNLGGMGGRPMNIAKYRQAIAAGKTEAEAVAAVKQMRSNAAKSAAATKAAKRIANIAATVKNTGAAGAALIVPAPAVAAALKKNYNPFNNSPNNLLIFPAPAPAVKPGNKNPFNNFGGGRRTRRNRKSRRNTRRNRRN